MPEIVKGGALQLRMKLVRRSQRQMNNQVIGYSCFWDYGKVMRECRLK